MDYYRTNFAGKDQDFIDDIVGRSVVAYYGNYGMYKIDNVDFKTSPKSSFKDSTGKE